MTDQMRAVRLYAAGDLRLEEIPAPSDPPEGYVNLKVRAAGICGSDLHNYRTGQWISRSPSVAGHEFCGVIDAAGAGVSSLLVGDTVIADSRFWCGECRQCRDGYTNACEVLGFVGEICDGGFADLVQLPARLVHRHSPTVPSKVAAMAEPLAVALHALRKLRVPSCEPVLILGCGTIGGLAAILLSRLHDGIVLLADINREKAGFVAGLIDGVVIDMDKASISAATSGRPLRYALDATGSVKAISTLLDLLDGGGALGLVGIGHGSIDLDPNTLVEREIALVGCHAFIDELPEAVALLDDLQPLLCQVSEVITLEDVPAAYERLIDSGSQQLKTIVAIAD